MEDIIDIIVTETTNLIEITSQPTDEVIDVNIIDNREDITLNVTPSVVEININSLTGNFGVEWGDITGTLSNQTDLNTALSLKADLVDGKVPSSQLPSYVDDVVEVANYASLPATGEVGKIYITLDTNFIYRWTGSTYVEIKDSSAVWGAITGTLSSQTDLQNALNLKANDNAVVHNTGNETIAGQKTFTGEVISTIQLTSPTIKVQNSGNASLYSLLLTNSSGIRNVYLPDADGTIALTSNLHNPVTLGTANGLSLSTQVLSLGLASSSANGALSSTDWTTFNNKLSTATAAATYVPYAGATGAVNLGAYDLTVNGITVGIGAGNMSSNTAIGASVLASNTNGSNNAALGYFSLNSNTTGGANTAIGSQTLKSNTNGTFNIAVGYGSLFNSVSANYNTAIGNSALYNTTGSSNTAIGDGAGYNITTGIFNTLIGGYFGTSSMSYNVILSDGARNIRFQFDGTNTLLGQSGNVLINTSTNAGYKLDVNGTGRFTGALSGTSASFSGLTVENNQNGSTWVISKNTNSGAGAAAGFLMTNNTGDLGAISLLSSGNSPANGLFIRTLSTNSLILGTNSTANLTIASGGAATFSSSVTAGGVINANQSIILGGTTNNINSDNSLLLYSGNNNVYLQGSGGLQLFESSARNNGIGIQSNISFFLSNSERMRITSAGNVGIGTTAPANYTNYVTQTINGTNGAILQLQAGGTASLRLIGEGVDTYIDNVSTGAMMFRTGSSSTERMRITSGGNVGIGTTSPGTTLHVLGGAAPVIFAGNSTTFYTTYRYNTSTDVGYIGNGQGVAIGGGQADFGFQAIGNMLFAAGGGTERMRITSGGDLIFTGQSSSKIQFYNSYSGSPSNVGLALFNTAGTTTIALNANGGGAYFASLGTGLVYSSGGSLTSTNPSDSRLKENIKTISYGLSDIMRLRPVSYNWKEDKINQGIQFGFIAQEVQEIMPDAIKEFGEETKFLGLEKDAIYATLVNAIKELNKKIEILENK